MSVAQVDDYKLTARGLIGLRNLGNTVLHTVSQKKLWCQTFWDNFINC